MNFIEFRIRYRVVFVNIFRFNPFSNDEDIHPSEESYQEDNLGNEFENEIKRSSEVGSVEALHDDSHGHLEDS